MRQITWPDGKKFAFTIVDDTDRATLENVSPVYAFLQDLGFRTTKTVWPSRGGDAPINGGATCEDRDYADWLLNLQAAGFEIAYHLNTYHTSNRQQIIAGLERFKSLFGHYPSLAANHVGCRDGIYWGDARFDGMARTFYNLANGFHTRDISRGHVVGDELFWGDICRDRIKYVRGFVFNDIDSRRHCTFMPYHDPSRPYVNNWFASSDGGDLQRFQSCIAEHKQERLENDGGVCIMYTHFAFGFCDHKGHISQPFARLMERLSKRAGWFAPASTILDHIQAQQGGTHLLSRQEKSRLAAIWLTEKISERVFRAA